MASQQPTVLTAKGQNVTVTFDGVSVRFTRGWMSRGGKGEAEFPLRTLTGVDLVMPGISAMAGRFTLVAAGGSVQVHSRQDPMTVTFTYPHRKEFEALAAAVRRALAQPQIVVQPVVAAPTPPAGGLDAQLANLAALHASGALTQEEFTAAKARLLGGPTGPQDAAPQQW
jgi:hypothetical protein